MRQLDPQLEPNSISGSDSIPKKALGMPNVRKSYDMPIKTGKKNADQTNLGKLRTYPHPCS
jgi:hypothetical protein